MAKNKDKPSNREINNYIEAMKSEIGEISKRKEMSWTLLSQIKAYLRCSPTSKHVMEIMGIHKKTWYRWKQEGDGYLKQLEEKEIEPNKLTERQQQLITFVYTIKTSKSIQIKKAWNQLEKLADKDFRAVQYLLRVLDPETFNIESKHRLSGGLDNTSEKEHDRITETLQEFMPKNSIEDLEGESSDS